MTASPAPPGTPTGDLGPRQPPGCLIYLCLFVVRMHGNLFPEEPVADLEKLEEDFVNIVKEKIKSDPENMLMMNKVRFGRNYLASRLGTI